MPNRYKFTLGDIVTDENGDEFVVVDRKMHIETSSYYAVPMDKMRRRIGIPTWKFTYLLNKTGQHSNKGSLRTFRANRQLEAEVGRGCRCECCVHVAMDRKAFTNKGRFLWDEGEEEDGET